MGQTHVKCMKCHVNLRSEPVSRKLTESLDVHRRKCCMFGPNVLRSLVEQECQGRLSLPHSASQALGKRQYTNARICSSGLERSRKRCTARGGEDSGELKTLGESGEPDKLSMAQGSDFRNVIRCKRGQRV
jgi:hypothetical protein